MDKTAYLIEQVIEVNKNTKRDEARTKKLTNISDAVKNHKILTH